MSLRVIGNYYEKRSFFYLRLYAKNYSVFWEDEHIPCNIECLDLLPRSALKIWRIIFKSLPKLF